MAVDPGFIFYPGDYLRDTQCLSEKAQVAYDRIMCEHWRQLVISEDRLRFFTKRLSEDEREELLHVLSVVDGGYEITWVSESIQKRKNFVESRRQSRLKSDEDAVRIYIVRDNVRSTYKIGSSVNPIRRFNELNNQKAPAIMADEQSSRDISLVWYSECVERKQEKILHDKFKSKHLYGEWFSLSAEDLRGIYSIYPGITYEKRTTNRTGIDIENDNEDEAGKGNQEGGVGETEQYGDERLLVPQMLDRWKQAIPHYPDDPQLDGKALYSIAGFLCKRGNLRGAPDVNAEPILEAWEQLCAFIADERFYKQKSLKTIANCIQEILQKALNGDQSKPTETKRNGKNLDPEKLKAGLRNRFAQRQRGEG